MTALSVFHSYTGPDSDGMPVFINQCFGHDGGSLSARAHADYVSAIEVWTQNGPGDNEVLKAIKVTWNTGMQQTYGHPNDQVSQKITFDSDDRIRLMSINSGDWVDSILIISNKWVAWKVGGDGGNYKEQNVGNGVLVGFNVKAGSDIDSLGAIFHQ